MVLFGILPQFSNSREGNVENIGVNDKSEHSHLLFGEAWSKILKKFIEKRSTLFCQASNYKIFVTVLL